MNAALQALLRCNPADGPDVSSGQSPPFGADAELSELSLQA